MGKLDRDAKNIARNHNGCAFILVVGPTGVHASVQGTPDEAVRMPDMLRHIAHEMERQRVGQVRIPGTGLPLLI